MNDVFCQPVARRRVFQNLTRRFALANLIGIAFFLLAFAATIHAALPRQAVLDNFHEVTAWKASASDQVRASIKRDGDGSLCLHYDFGSVSGYAVMRRELPLEWPEQFELVAQLKGSGATNDLQLKFVDAGGENVWWVNRPNYTLPRSLVEMKIKRRNIEFAWGPTPDHVLHRTRYIEFVIAAGQHPSAGGGKGSLCVAKLTLTERAPDPAPWSTPKMTMNGDTLDIDYGNIREFSGLVLRWPRGNPQRDAGRHDYNVLVSDNALQWRLLRRVRGSDGKLDALYVPESEARYLRVKMLRNGPQPAVELRDSARWLTFNAVLSELGRAAPRGDVPRTFLGEQNYWTLVGVDGGGERSGLISEDGAIEVGRGGYSVEPAVILDDGTRVTWADAKTTQHLRDGYLPIPSVRWEHAAFSLDIESAADGISVSPELMARYRLRNIGTQTRTFTLLLAIRPWQVNPPQQFLSMPGGASAIHHLHWTGNGLLVNNHSLLKPDAAPQRVSVLPLDGGLNLTALTSATKLSTLRDDQSHASAALQFQVTLKPGAIHTFGWVAQLGTQRHRRNNTASLDTRFDTVAARWRERLNRVQISVPASEQRIVDTMRTSLAHILMSRDGVALRPGTRSYARTWIRDGAMMVAALVRLGEIDAAREFIDWYAEHIFDSGKVPCCVDGRGADPVVENDSQGQYLYAVAELWRFTRDRTFLERHWPTVQRVVAYMESLRQLQRSDINRVTERAHFFGLMPPSISHEGYSDKVAYSYWDNFWSLRGFKDAVIIAQALNHDNAQWARWRDEFERELMSSILATATHHGIDFIAGAADRGDFDATSTTMALNPAQAQNVLPATLLRNTFERYWQNSLTRNKAKSEWNDYTPYELRNVGALVRLGQPERAQAMLRFFFSDQRPLGWNQWAEVVMRRYREAHFLGDMPHAWVSSDYIRSALDLFAFERESDATLVIAAGLTPDWLAQGTIGVHDLSTPFGKLDFQLARTDRGWLLRMPQKLSNELRGVRLAWAGSLALPIALHEGRPLEWQGRELPLPSAPCTIELISD